MSIASLLDYSSHCTQLDDKLDLVAVTQCDWTGPKTCISFLLPLDENGHQCQNRLQEAKTSDNF